MDLVFEALDRSAAVGGVVPRQLQCDQAMTKAIICLPDDAQRPSPASCQTNESSLAALTICQQIDHVGAQGKSRSVLIQGRRVTIRRQVSREVFILDQVGWQPRRVDERPVDACQSGAVSLDSRA